jgi:agmatine deiminase
LWEDDLATAQAEVAALVGALTGPGGEQVKLMVRGEAAKAEAERLLADVAGVEVVMAEFGDIWLRDTGPIFTARGEAAAFAFNGWGGKYILDGDEAVAGTIATGASLKRHPFVLEGGAIDHDGEGTVLTTRQCLLNPNRNRGWREGEAERALSEALGARKVLWLDQGLMNDHTDGHIDNLARFVAPGAVACPASLGEDDPNAAIYDAAARALSGMEDAAGRRLRVERIPSPGRIVADHRVQPASHMNFVIANTAVIAPTYGGRAGEWAIEALEALFPGRAVIGLPSTALLTGGGSFHCITQQEPA